jgi:hypothetical protein
MSPEFKKAVTATLLVIPIALSFVIIKDTTRENNPETKINNNKKLYIEAQTKGEADRLSELGREIIGSWIYTVGNIHTGVIIFKEKNKFKVNYGPTMGVDSELYALKKRKEFKYRFKKGDDKLEITEKNVLVMSDEQGEIARLNPL